MNTSGVNFYNSANLYFKNRKRIKLFLTKMSKTEGREIETLNYIFCSTEKIIEINSQYLSHHYATDIITFDLSKNKTSKITSDIYICPEIVKTNAIDYSETFTRELHRVIFHGLLHLCGYGDKTNSQQKVMRAKEEEWLRKYFVPRGTKKR